MLMRTRSIAVKSAVKFNTVCANVPRKEIHGWLIFSRWIEEATQIVKPIIREIKNIQSVVIFSLTITLT